jgi:hypothetical protein
VRRLFRLTRKAGERCELCGLSLDPQHAHVYEPRARQMRCACKACELIIPTRAEGTYRQVPRRFDALTLEPAQLLRQLGVPVGVAAIVVRDDGRMVACYPGAAGLVESELAADEVAGLPPLAPEVEAVLLSSMATTGAWHVGIDVVFELVGEVRTAWRGMTGGPDVTAAIERVIAGAQG